MGGGGADDAVVGGSGGGDGDDCDTSPQEWRQWLYALAVINSAFSDTFPVMNSEHLCEFSEMPFKCNGIYNNWNIFNNPPSSSSSIFKSNGCHRYHSHRSHGQSVEIK